MVYIQGHSVPQANHEVLDLLVAARNELAQVGNYNMVRKMQYSAMRHLDIRRYCLI